MWFKNVQLYNLVVPMEDSATELAGKLEQMVFAPGLATMSLTSGWISPIDQDNAPLVHAFGDRMLICLQIEEKILPATIVRQELDEKIKHLESERDRKVSSKEKFVIKENLIATLMPRAFAKRSRVYAYFDKKKNWFVVDTTNANKTQLLFKSLEKVLPNLVFQSPKLKKTLPIMTYWIQERSPEFFEIGKNCVLQDPKQQGRSIRCTQQDLFSKNIQNVLRDGHEVIQIALAWQEQVDFTLTDKFLLRSIKFQDAILQLAEDNMGENETDSFHADFMIMTDILTKLLDDLLGVFAKRDNEE